MLQSRIAVIVAYLKSQPASYLTDASLPPSGNKSIDHSILRSISALEAQLRLASPADFVGIAQESDQSKTDVELITLLSNLTKSVGDVKTLKRRWATVEPQKRKMQIGNVLGSQIPDTAAEDPPMDLL
jgi:COP9 signalosome complex subunit 6